MALSPVERSLLRRVEALERANAKKKRKAKPPTPAQIAARKKFVEKYGKKPKTK